MEGQTVADVEFLDFSRLVRRSSPNDRLIAPAGETSAAVDGPAPVFAATPGEVAQAWLGVVASESRTAVLAVSGDGLAVEAQQRSRVFGFVDRISMRALPLAAGRSTLAVYSRSEEGWWDLGVNSRRLDAWIAALRDRLPAAHPPERGR